MTTPKAPKSNVPERVFALTCNPCHVTWYIEPDDGKSLPKFCPKCGGKAKRDAC